MYDKSYKIIQINDDKQFKIYILINYKLNFIAIRNEINTGSCNKHDLG